MEGAFSRRACEVLSRAFSSPMSYQNPLSSFMLPFRAKKRPGGFMARISLTMDEAINRFSRLKRAVR